MRYIITIIVSMLLAGTIYPNNSKDSCEVRNSTFRSGEQVKYILSYNWFFIWTDVGEATFKVSNDTLEGQEAIHLHTFGHTYTFYDWFYKVRDTHESWVDPNTLQPLYFNRDVNQGSYTKENEYWFDWQSSSISARIRRRGRENNFYEIPMKDCTYDVVSAMYMARNLDFSDIRPNASFPLDVALDEEVYNVTYRFLKREQKNIRGVGRFNTLMFRVELIAGDIFDKGQYLDVWVTDDANRLPIYIESPIRVGKVRVRIAEWEGLRHPLTSRVR